MIKMSETSKRFMKPNQTLLNANNFVNESLIPLVNKDIDFLKIKIEEIGNTIENMSDLSIIEQKLVESEFIKDYATTVLNNIINVYKKALKEC